MYGLFQFVGNILKNSFLSFGTQDTMSLNLITLKTYNLKLYNTKDNSNNICKCISTYHIYLLRWGPGETWPWKINLNSQSSINSFSRRVNLLSFGKISVRQVYFAPMQLIYLDMVHGQLLPVKKYCYKTYYVLFLCANAVCMKTYSCAVVFILNLDKVSLKKLFPTMNI